MNSILNWKTLNEILVSDYNYHGPGKQNIKKIKNQSTNK